MLQNKDQRLFRADLSLSGNNKIKDLPLLHRPREKALYYGINALSEVELLAILIGEGTSGASALTLASRLLDEHLSLTNLYRIKDHLKLKIPGIGVVKGLRLIACFELTKRLGIAREERDVFLYNAEEITKLYQNKIGRLNKETLYLIALNKRLHIISEKQIYLGHERGFIIDSKEIIRELVISGAEYYVLIHNHPSGIVSPSENDIKTTTELAKLSRNLGIELYDHIIVTHLEYFSIREYGKLPRK